MSMLVSSAFGDFNSLWLVVVGAGVIVLTYSIYAKRIDRTVIQAREHRTTPARTHVDGFDFVPTNRSVLFAYHSKSIATAGSVLGAVVAVQLWGWLPALLWLAVGVSFIGWVSDYSAVMLSVRNEGNSLPAISQRLISPRSRIVLFAMLLVHLVLMASAFVGILAGIVEERPDIPLGLVALAAMGFVAGWLIYRRRNRLVGATALAVGTVLLAMALGPLGVKLSTRQPPSWEAGPISGAFHSLRNAVDSNRPLYTVLDPTGEDPRVSTDGRTHEPIGARSNVSRAVRVDFFPSYILWAVLLLGFAYVSATFSVHRFAVPVNYVAFWVVAVFVGVCALGAVMAPFGVAEATNGKFLVKAFTSFTPPQSNAAAQPLWPMLFITIGCGAISGWHAVFGSYITARQLEYETDALPVAAGGMFSDHTLALVSLVAVAITGAFGIRAFSSGVGRLLNVGTFGIVSPTFGGALGFAVFVVVVLTVLHVVVRVTRQAMTEWMGERWTALKNPRVATVIFGAVVLFLVLTESWIYLWQLFGASNQLLATLSLVIVTVWLTAEGRPALFAAVPMAFMLVTASAGALVTAWNVMRTIGTESGPALSQIGGWALALLALALVAGAGVVVWDAYRAWALLRAPPRAEADLA